MLRPSILPAGTGRMDRAHLCTDSPAALLLCCRGCLLVMHRLLAQRLANLGLHCGFIHRSCPVYVACESCARRYEVVFDRQTIRGAGCDS